MARRLGRSGERRFATLVADYAPGATCNDSHDDEHGWDHVVEFDRTLIPGLPADLQAALPAVFVQTKTSADPAELKVTVKLSNALAFTRSENPCFVVLVSAPADGPVRFYAVHWWDRLMTRALRRARELSRDGIGEDQFHKREISFTMTTSDAHASGALLDWMRGTMAELGRNYAIAKAALRDTLGFEKGEIGGHIHIGPLESIEQLVDHQLGLTASIPMAKVELRQRRFDIDIPLPMPDWPVAFARLQAHPAARCDVRVRGPDGESFSIEGEVIAPVIPGLPEEHYKYRVRTPIFDVVFRPGGASRFHFTFDTAGTRPPAELEKVARFFGWAGGSEIEILVTVGDDRLFGATATLDPQPDTPGWRPIAAPLGTLARIAEGRKGPPALISIEQAGAAEWLDLMHSIVAATETTLRADLPPSLEPPAFDHAVSFAILTVGDWVFAAMLRLPRLGETREGQRWEVRFGQAVILETYLFQPEETKPFERLKADYARYAGREGAFAIDNLLLHLAREP